MTELKENKRYRAVAIKLKRKYYSKVYVSTWPTCVDCDGMIRDPSGWALRWRICNCEKRKWYPKPTGWEYEDA